MAVGVNQVEQLLLLSPGRLDLLGLPSNCKLVNGLSLGLGCVLILVSHEQVEVFEALVAQKRSKIGTRVLDKSLGWSRLA